jgi:hypothetical protein
MKASLLVVILAASSLGSSPWQTIPPAGKYNVYGAGTMSCGAWAVVRQKQDFREAGQWMMGFVSGAGWAGNKQLRKSDADGMSAWIDQYCAAHPLDELSDAAAALVQTLQSK